jgi:WD40 repeat protein/tetratricopeptide (TPR) repeat protein
LHTIRKDVPAELEAICDKAMMRELERRYANTLELAGDLRAYLEGRVVRAHRTGAVVELSKWVRRNRGLAASVAAAFLALVTGLSASLVLKARSDENASLAAERAVLAEDRRKEAEANKALAESNATRANEREEEARWQAYVASLLAADTARRLNEPSNLRRALDAAPSANRGWEWRYLSDQADSSLFVLRGGGRVGTPAFSPDGSRLVAHCEDRSARIWDAETGVEILALFPSGGGSGVGGPTFSQDGTRVIAVSEEKARVWDSNTGAVLLVLSEQDKSVRTAAFSPDGERIATSLDDGTVRIWDARTGAELLALSGFCSAAPFSSDGTRILTSDAKSARIWDAHSGTELRTLHGRGKDFAVATFSPDGARVITATYFDQAARIWDARTGAELFSLPHDGTIATADFSPDGLRIVTTYDRTVRIWDAHAGVELRTLPEHEEPVQAASFSSDGSRIVTASYDKTARIWDSLTGAELLTLRGHLNGVEWAVFSPDGSRVATRSWDGSVHVWDARKDEGPAVLRGHRESVVAVSFSPDGSRIVTASWDGTAVVWDALTGAEQLILGGHESRVWAASFSPDGARIVTASMDETVRVWDADARTTLRILQVREPRGTVGVRFGPFYASMATFSPDGSRIVTGSLGKTAHVWDVETGADLLTLRGHEDSVWSAAFSPDGSRIVTASSDKTVRVWNAETGVEVAVLHGHESDVGAAVFSHDGSLIVTASDDGSARLWNAETGNQLAVMSVKVFLGLLLGKVAAAVFSPDDSRILTVSSSPVESTARVWDTSTGEELLVLPLQGRVWSAVFSPDGARILTATEDATVRVWDSLTGTELLALRGHEGAVLSMAFSPDGSRIVTASSDKTARTWDGTSYRIRHAMLQRRTASEAEARNLLARLEPTSSNLAQVAATIRSDVGIDAVVRRVALDLLSKDKHEASVWVYGLYDELFSPEDVRAKVEADNGHRLVVKEHALLLAGSLKVDAERYNVVAWDIVRRPDRTPDEYRKALRVARVAATTRPKDADIANTLGVAQYRSGLYQDALETLTRAIELSKNKNNLSSRKPILSFLSLMGAARPGDLAFVAMAQCRLGDRKAAAASLVKLRELMQVEENASDHDNQGFLQEAEALIDPEDSASAK